MTSGVTELDHASSSGASAKSGSVGSAKEEGACGGENFAGGSGD